MTTVVSSFPMVTISLNTVQSPLLAEEDKGPKSGVRTNKGWRHWGAPALHKPSAATRGKPGGNQSVSVAPTLDSPMAVPSKTKTPLASKSGIHSGTAILHQGNARAVPAIRITAACSRPTTNEEMP